MLRRNIKDKLGKKHQDWVDSIRDEKLARHVKRTSFVAGGSITSVILGEEINDMDIYFENETVLIELLEYYKTILTRHHKTPYKVGHHGDLIEVVAGDGVMEAYEYIGGKGEVVEESKDYRPIFITPNAISLEHDIQLVIKFRGEPEDVGNGFDYVHTSNYYKPFGNKLRLNQSALESTISKQLRYTGSDYPLASLVRARKFMKRGWNITAGEFVKIAFDLQRFDLSDPRVLQDQLVGVDLTYFKILIEEVKEAAEGKEGYRVDPSMIFEMIDDAFYL